MIFLHTKCYLGGIRMGLCHVLFAKIKYGGPTWSMDANCHGLTVLGVSSHETMYRRNHNAFTRGITVHSQPPQ